MSEIIFSRRPLPRYFAVLRATSGGGPSYQFCETECESYEVQTDPPQNEHISIVKNAEIPREILCTLQRKTEEINEQDAQIYEYRMKNDAQSEIDIRKVKYWHLPHYFFWNEYKIPVLDFNKRFILTRSFVRVLPPNTNEEIMRSTVMTYEFIRERRICKIPVKQGGILHAPLELPQFVLKLLYDDQISRNESCSITMTPFREITKIGVTPCFHLFEAIALSRWIQSHHRCPLCRAATLGCQVYETTNVRSI